jgi:tetratricopeptide (TPR) repeat protein
MKYMLPFLLLATMVCTQVNAATGDSSLYYFQKAKAFKESGQVFEAEKNFQKSLEFDPANNEAREALGNFYCEQRKYVNARIQFKQLLENVPTHALALQKCTELSFLLRKWQDVIMYAAQAAKNNVQVDKVNYMLGKSHFEEENYGAAKDYLTKQLAQTPGHKESMLLVAEVYIELSNYTEAINTYKSYLLSYPDDGETIYQLALLYSAESQEREAVKYMELAAQKGYKQDLAYLENLGMSYLSFNLAKGVEVLNKVLERKPGDVQVLTQIAQAYYQAGDFGTAYESYYKIYQADNKNAKALYMSGVALIRKGDKSKGMQLCDMAIAIDPKLGTLRSQKSML